MDGWCSVEKANDLALAVIKLRAAVTVEVGVYGGRSVAPMALACAEQDFGVVWAIDPWDQKASAEGYDPVNANWWGNLDHEMIYQRFLAHLKANGLERFVKIIRKRSDDVEPPKVLDIFHLDGQHTDQAVKDIERFAPNIRAGGFCFVDDIQWSGGGVGRAVDKLMGMGFVKLFDRDTGAMFQRETAKPSAPKKKGGWPKGKKRKK